MSLRALPDSFVSTVVEAIDGRLTDICADEGVSIPLAIESGSRAWGFPSPDSDYDCRFVFVRPIQQLLSPWPRRDVIETPLDAVLDVNGWDLAKALKLLLKGNTVIIEWLQSPVIYRGEAWFRDDFLEIAARHADRAMVGRHYLHLGERQRRVYFGDGQNVAQKKIFYALRPAVALRWMRLRPETRLAPMHFPTLLEECDPPADVAELTADLMQRKALTHELGIEPLHPTIAAFLEQEFELARAEFESGPVEPSEAARRDCESFFRNTVLRLDAGYGRRPT